MVEFKRPELVKLIVFFTAAFLLLEIDAQECSTKCQDGTKLTDGFLKGHSYTYSFKGWSNIHLTGAENQHTDAAVHAVVKVYGLGDCSNILKIANLKLIGPNETEYASPDEIVKPIRFSMQNGVIGGEICSESGDSQTSLNIKRAIISMLQAAHKQDTEVDIFGDCKTEFFVDDHTVRKSKDLNSCTKRIQNERSLLSQIYNADIEFKTKHIMKADLTVKMVINSGIVQQSKSREEYLFVPFSKKGAGAKSIVLSMLELTEITVETSESNCIVPKSIVFEHVQIKSSKGNVKKITDALLFVAEHLEDHVHPDSASLFVDVIKILRVSYKDDITTVFNIIKEKKNQELLRNILMDALVRTGSSESIEVLIEFLKQELDPLEKKLILASFTNVKHVTFDTVKAFNELLTIPDLPNDAYVSVGSIAGSYCREYSCHGDSLSPSQKEVIVSLTETLVAKLGNCKTDYKTHEDKVVSVLRALKNIDHIEDNAVDTLAACATNKDASSRVRSTVLDVFTADPCIKKLKDISLAILEDREEDSELRIKAYLSLLQCPCNKFVTDVQNILNHPKPSLQAGSYIASSLKNILDSENPSTEGVRNFFSNLTYGNSFPIDPRKYSQAYEMNMANERFGLKSLVQSDVIYSQKSFLPRSLNLNISAEIFGMNLNIMEVGMRQDNLEHVFEELFGPQGGFQKYTPQTFYNMLNASFNNAYPKNKKKNGNKTKRETMGEFAERKHPGSLRKDDQRMDIDVFIKLFGHDAVFLSLRDNQDFLFEDLTKRFYNFMGTRSNGAEKFTHEVRSHNFFLDFELNYPTMSGLPLKLNVEGASTGKLKFGGEFDMEQIFNDALNSKFHFTLVPSASIQIVGAVAIDADVFTTGLKVATTLQTSTGVEINAKLIDGRGFDIDIGFPLEKQEIITFTSDIQYFIKKNGEKEVQKMVKFRHQSNWDMCINGRDDTRTSFNLCLQTNDALFELFYGDYEDLSNKKNTPKFPLNGQKKIILYFPLGKKMKYQFSGMFGHVDNKMVLETHIQTKFYIDEGIENGSRLSVRIESDNHGSFSTAILMDGEEYTVNQIYEFTNKPHEKSLNAIFQYKLKYHKLDDVDSVKIGVIIKEQGTRTTYLPFMEFKKNGILREESVQLRGALHVDPVGDKFNCTFDELGIVLIKYYRVSINGWSISHRQGVSWDMTLSSGNDEKMKKMFHSGKIFHDYIDGTTDIQIASDYNDFYENFKFLYKQNNNVIKNLNGSIAFIGSYVFTYENDPSGTKNTMVFNTHTTMKNVGEFTYHRKQDLSIPTINLIHRGEIEYKDQKKLKLLFFGEHKRNSIDFIFDADDYNTNENEKYGQIKISLNNEGIELYLSVKNESEEKTKVKSHMMILPNDKYELDVMINEEQRADDDFRLSLAGQCQFPQTKIYRFDVSHAVTSKLIVSNALLTRATTKLFEFKAKLDLEKMFGEMNAVINDVVIIKGQYKLKPAEKTINAVFNVNMSKNDKIVQIETSIVSNEPIYSVELKIFPNFGKDKNSVYKLTTATSIEDDAIDSKNTLFIGDKQTKLNFVAKAVGNNANGKRKIGMEFIKPTEVSYVLTYTDEIDSYESLANETIHIFLQWTDAKAANPRILTTQFNIFDHNKETSTGTTIIKSIYVRESGENLYYTLQTMVNDRNGRKEVEFKTDLTGSLIENPLDFHTFIDYKIHSDFFWKRNTDFNFKIKGNYGKETSVNTSGTVIVSSSNAFNQNYKLNADIEMFLPLERLKTLRWTTMNTASYVYTYDTKAHALSVKSLSTTSINDEKYIYEYNLEDNVNIFTTKMALDIPKNQPFLLEFSNNRTIDNESHKRHIDMFMKSNGQTLSYSMSVENLFPNGGKFNSVLILPDSMRYHIIKTDGMIMIESPDRIHYVCDLDVDGKEYSHTADLAFDSNATLRVDLKTSYPNKAIKRLYVKATDVTKEEFHGHAMIVQDIGDFNLDLLFNGKVKSVKDFDLKMDIDCAEWNMTRYHFEAVNAPPQSGVQMLKILGSENGKTFFNAMTEVNDILTDDSLTISGSSKFVWKSTEHPTSFKLLRYFDETGVAVSFDASIEDKTIQLHYGNMNTKYTFDVNYCEVTRCAYLNWKLINESSQNITHKEFDMGLDVTSLGYPYITKLHMLKILDNRTHTTPTFNVDWYLQKEDSKYRYEFNGMTHNNTYKTVSTIEIPSRNITAETTFSINPAFCNNGPPMIGEIIFLLNASDPTSKTHFVTNIDCNRRWYNQKLNGSVYFIHPGASKEMSMELKSVMALKAYKTEVTLILDIFKRKDQRLFINGSILPHSTINDGTPSGFIVKLNIEDEAQQIGYEAYGEYNIAEDYKTNFEIHEQRMAEGQKSENAVHLIFQPDHQELTVVLPAGDLLRFENSIDIILNLFPTGVVWTSNMTLLNNRRYNGEAKFSVCEGLRASWDVGYIDPAEYIQVEAVYMVGKKAEVRTTHCVNKENHDILTVGYMQDHNFSPVSTSKVNSKYLRKALEGPPAYWESFLAQASEYGLKNFEIENNITTKLADIFWDSIPDMDLTYFEKELNAIEQEIKNDTFLNHMEIPIKLLMMVSNSVVKNIIVGVTTATELVTTILDDIGEGSEEYMITTLKQIVEKLGLGTFYIDAYENFITYIEELAAYVTPFIDIYASQWISLTDGVFSGLCNTYSEVSKIVMKIIENVPKYIAQFKESLYDGYLKDYLYPYQSALTLGANSVLYMSDALTDLLPIEEWNDFQDAFIQYHDQVISHKVSKMYFETLQDVLYRGKILAMAIQEKIKDTKPIKRNFYVYSTLMQWIDNIDTFVITGMLPTTFDIANLENSHKNIRIPSFNPKDIFLPQELRGFMAAGHHMFTFDGSYLHFPQDCDFVITRDIVDGNFSINMQQRGDAKSLLFVDANANSVEVNNQGEISLGGPLKDLDNSLPLLHLDVQGYRKGNTFILESKYGVTIKCFNDLSLCYFRISGYYFGKLSGLLGDGNSEPSDDHKDINGKVIDSDNEVRSMYAHKAKCLEQDFSENTIVSGMKKVDSETQPIQPICSEIFKKDSLFSFCSMVIDVNPYKSACSEAYNAAIPDASASSAACLIAKTYALACKSHGVPVLLPPVCVSCNFEGREYNTTDDEINIQIPDKQADIVLVVETSMPNEKVFRKLVTPMVSRIVEELKKSQIEDVKLYLVGVKHDSFYPLQYDLKNQTLSGNKMSFEDSANWYDNSAASSFQTNDANLDKYISELSHYALKNLHIFHSELRMNNIQIAYHSLNDLALRPQSVKTVIMVNAEPCKSSFLSNRAKFFLPLMQEEGIVTHLISPVIYKKTDIDFKDYIGFNNNAAFVLNANDPEQPRRGLTHEQDECIDLALNTFGNVYSTNVFNAIDEEKHEQYINLAAKTIINSMRKVSYEKNCKCEIGLMKITPKMKCVTVARNDTRIFESGQQFTPNFIRNLKYGRFLSGFF